MADYKLSKLQRGSTSGQIVRPQSAFVATGTNLQYMPTLEAGSSDYFDLGTSDTTDRVRKNSSGTTLWSVGYTDVNASADRWSGFIHLDSITGELWVMVEDDSGPTFYLATLDATTGTVTQKGNFTDATFDSAIASRWAAPQRENEDSGDFEMVVGGYRFVMTSAGSLTTSEIWTPPGVTNTYALGGLSGLLNPEGTHVLSVLSGSIGTYYYSGATNTNALANYIDKWWGHETGGGNLGIWGPYVGLIHYNNGGNGSFDGDRFFDKEDFFRFITESLVGD